MNNNKTTTAAGGMGMLEVLQIIFIVLKCLKLIDWSWKVVLIPTWIGLGILALCIVLIIAASLYNARH